MPKVSVVIPLYNKQEHIRRTIDSVLAQTSGDWEIVVVDDGSTDQSAAIVEDYASADTRVRLLRQANAGPGAARNHAIRESRGEWIAPLDADDAWKPAWIETMLRLAEAHPACDAVLCLWHTDPNDEDDVALRYRRYRMPDGAYRLDPGVNVQQMRRLMTRFGSRNTLIRRSFIVHKTTGFHEGVRHGEDHYLWAQVLLNASVYLADDVLAFQDHEASGLASGLRKRGILPPLRPLVRDPDPVRARTPPEYRPLVERWLTAMAKSEAWTQIKAGRPEEARRCLDLYPDLIEGPMDRFKFRCWMKMAAANRDRHIDHWVWYHRLVYKRAKWLRPRIVRVADNRAR